MTANASSLLNFVDAPVLVGDPDGLAIYVNPAFEVGFSISRDAAVGQPLAGLFEGGGREAVLHAVAGVCAQGGTVRFRLRHGDVGYSAIASPITADDDRVGVVLLLTEAAGADERLHAFHREMQEPLDQLRRSLEELLEQTGGRRSERYRSLVEESLRSLERTRKWAHELHARLSGEVVRNAAHLSFDPVRVVREAAARVKGDFVGAGVELEMLVPAELPKGQGDGARLELALVRLLRSRLDEAEASATMTLAAKRVGEGADASLLVSVSEGPSAARRPGQPEPPVIREMIEEMGGRLHTAEDSKAGRTTSIQLRIAPA